MLLCSAIMSENDLITSPEVKWRMPDSAPSAIRRLLVLLPDAEINEALLARTLWTITAHTHARILVIARVDDWANEGLARLRLAMVTTLLREARIEPQTQLAAGSDDWAQLVKRIYLPGDAIVCPAEQKILVRGEGLRTTFKPLSHYFAALSMPMCEIQGIVRARQEMTPARAFKTGVLPLLIVIVSVVLQVLFLSWAHEWAAWARQTVLAISTAIEIITVAWLARSWS
jgi:hypothetical protein